MLGNNESQNCGTMGQKVSDTLGQKPGKCYPLALGQNLNEI